MRDWTRPTTIEECLTSVGMTGLPVYVTSAFMRDLCERIIALEHRIDRADGESNG